jgi:hypothetical protein
MPSSSDKQRRLFSVVKSVQSGEADPETVSDKVKQLAKKLDKQTVDDFAKSEERSQPYKTESLRRVSGMLREINKKKYG